MAVILLALDESGKLDNTEDVVFGGSMFETGWAIAVWCSPVNCKKMKPFETLWKIVLGARLIVSC